VLASVRAGCAGGALCRLRAAAVARWHPRGASGPWARSSPVDISVLLMKHGSEISEMRASGITSPFLIAATHSARPPLFRDAYRPVRWDEVNLEVASSLGRGQFGGGPFLGRAPRVGGTPSEPQRASTMMP
jgi:hypothetical protein